MKNDIANGNKDLYPLWPAIDIHRSVFPAYASSLIGEEKVCASNNKKQQKLQYLNSHLIKFMCQRFWLGRESPVKPFQSHGLSNMKFWLRWSSYPLMMMIILFLHVCCQSDILSVTSDVLGWPCVCVCVCRNLASFDSPGREETWGDLDQRETEETKKCQFTTPEYTLPVLKSVSSKYWKEIKTKIFKN